MIHPEIVKAPCRFGIAEVVRLETMNTPDSPGRSETIHDDGLSAVLKVRQGLQASDASFKHFDLLWENTALVQFAKNVNAEPIVSTP